MSPALNVTQNKSLSERDLEVGVRQDARERRHHAQAVLADVSEGGGAATGTEIGGISCSTTASNVSSFVIHTTLVRRGNAARRPIPWTGHARAGERRGEHHVEHLDVLADVGE